MSSHGLKPNERVLTPSGRVATVVGYDNHGDLTLRYPGESVHDAFVTLAPKLVRQWTNGAPRPHPARIGISGKVVG